MYTPPSTWPITSSGLIERPTSCAIQTLSTRMSPVSRSADSSTTAAQYEYVGVGSTPPPFPFAAYYGGVSEPTEPSVPDAASASTTASTKVSDFDSSAATQ